MDAAEHSRVLLEVARRDFCGFYAVASRRDADLMDSLVLGHAALVVLVNAPREKVAPVIRTELERATNANEQLFTDLREAVRACPTFAALSIGEQLAIERVIFEVRPAWSE